VGDEIRRLIETRASSKEIHDAAVARGMRTLRDDGIRLCLEGVTTFAEVQRVLGAED
jgi:type II secretory ATPase GspE/PulE/Tfp pilus assembly ATPase PilB-like protein